MEETELLKDENVKLKKMWKEFEDWARDISLPYERIYPDILNKMRHLERKFHLRKILKEVI
jgi:hypothetical protein